jgi:hypothetical protein
MYWDAETVGPDHSRYRIFPCTVNVQCLYFVHQLHYYISSTSLALRQSSSSGYNTPHSTIPLVSDSIYDFKPYLCMETSSPLHRTTDLYGESSFSQQKTGNDYLHYLVIRHRFSILAQTAQKTHQSVAAGIA